MNLKFLKDLWNPAETVGMDEPELLRYRSNLLGSDLRLTNYGGGNTSAKITVADPVTNEPTKVLWVKGSGGDLGSIKRDGFATLYLDRLNALKNSYRSVEQEDAFADKYGLCTFNNNPRAASIDTPLHGFLPYPHVDHLHPDWAIALAASENGPDHLPLIEKELGLKLAWLPWKRPGFELGLWLEKSDKENPGYDGIILGSHGLFTWGETGYESYRKTLEVIDGIGQYVLNFVENKGSKLFGGAKVEMDPTANELAIELFPVIRGAVGPMVGHFDQSPEVVRFINSNDAEMLAAQGTSCPDHFIRTKVRPLFVPASPGDTAETLTAKFRSALAAYRADYSRYYAENKKPDSPLERSSSPTVVVVPGVGVFSFGKNKTEARITSEFYRNAIHVMEGATAMAGLPTPSERNPLAMENYVALSPAEAFGIEYWLLEEAKLKRQPPEKELSRKVALLVGASPGMGFQVASQLLSSGAHVVIADRNVSLAEELRARLAIQFGAESVAATGIDIVDRASVQTALNYVTIQFGGLDIVVNLAAVFFPPSVEGKISDEQWMKTFEINVIGSNILAEETGALIRRQGTRATLVLTSSANAVVSKKGSVAYDVSKTAINHLVRELAIEQSPLLRVNAVAPATVVEGSQMFPRDRVISSLAKYSLEFTESESTEELREKLAHFYASRSLLKVPVSPQRVANAILWFCSEKSDQTTGHIHPVDAGLHEAFLR